jgi:predicted site-specific integrase-resolvase
VADILRKDDRLSREINRLYPGLNPRASRLETAGVSTILGSSLGRDTFGPSSDDLIPRPAPPSNNAVVVGDVDDSDASDSDSEPGILTPTSSEFPLSELDEEKSDPGYQLSLAPVINLSAIRVPVAMSEKPYTRRTAAHHDSRDEHPPPIPPPIFNSSSLRVLTVSTSGVDISPLPEDIDTSLPQRTPNKALSADAVFQLPDITDQIVLDFFRRVLEVSRFATQFADGKLPMTGSGGRLSAPKERLEHLRPRQLREVCTDLYDELVRRNLEDQNKNRRESADKVQFVEPEGLNAKRRQARRKLLDLRDDQMVKFITLVLRELETRCGASMYDGSLAAESRAAAVLSLQEAEEDLRRKMLVWARDSI